MNDITVLVSTMNRSNLNFFREMNIKTPAIIVNQLPQSNLVQDDYIDRGRVKLINTKNRGISNSRNLLLENANNKISIVADDDMRFVDDYPQIIETAYRRNPDADLICFQVPRVGKNAEMRQKTYSPKKKSLSYLDSMKISSVEMTFKTESIKNAGIRYNPNIGAGTQFLNGEENQFLFDCLRAGLKILYIPVKIATVDVSESSWFEGFNEHYFESTGAKFYNMTHTYYHLLIWQFALRKRKLYANQFSMGEVIQLMYDGVDKYKNLYEE